VAGCGFLSTLLGGIVSDKYERKSKMTKSLVCILGGLAAIVPIGVATLVTNNFWLSLFAMGLKYLLAESWMSPAITMMQSTVKPEEQGSIVSAHLFFLTIVGCASTVTLGAVSNALGVASNPAIYGKLIFLWNIIGYLGAAPFFWIGGKKYKEHLERKERERLAIN
jgi:MFS family permease